ncbi:alpha/beta hydrolase [Virgibacillus necropolis]|uniref:alpha/beta hydrolase family protein n=1 Tax=Virgibacillus necropolis TaxID=163877 RepID=UPI00384C6DDC
MKAWIIKIGLLFGLVILVTGCSDDTGQKEQKGDGDEVTMDTLAGTWNGSIQIPNQPLPIMISFEKGKGITGAISIPVQGVKDYPLSAITIDKSNISFEMDIQGQLITFDGKIEKKVIEGTFTQNGQSFPFELSKGKGEVADTEEEEGQFLSIDTGKGKLYGEVEIPDGEGPYPVMIIIPGSGPTDRNGNSVALPGKNNSLKLLAEQLAENGIASVRYDKRGVGKNQSTAISEKDLRFDRFVKDAVAWAEMLAKDKRFSNVGIIGHSQGSLVGILAAHETDVDAFVSIAGAGRSIDQVLYDQLRKELPDDLTKESKDILDKLKQGKHVEDISQELQSVFRPSVQPFLSSWMQYNPAEEIQKLDVPVLIVNGKRDIQVPVSEAKILHQAKKDAEFLLIPKMNHVLKEAPEDRKGNLQTYSNPDLPLAQGLIDGIVSFLEN